MARKNKNVESDEAPGAPEWMVTFSDCMTLLLTFFVLLLSFSSFDDKVFRKLDNSMSDSFASITMNTAREKDAVIEQRQITPTEELSAGSEKPTENGEMAENIKSKPDSEDYKKQKVFLVPSSQMFWGKGTVISNNGKEVLAKLGNFLGKVEDRVVIYEGNGDKNNNNGMDRTWTIINYLTDQGLERNRFNISAASALSQNAKLEGMKDNDSHLEITLLERNLHN